MSLASLVRTRPRHGPPVEHACSSSSTRPSSSSRPSLAYYARFEGVVPPDFAPWMLPLDRRSRSSSTSTLFALFGLYRLVLRYVGVDTLLQLFGGGRRSASPLLAAGRLPRHRSRACYRPVPLGVLFIQAVLVFLGAAAARLAARVLVVPARRRARARAAACSSSAPAAPARCCCARSRTAPTSGCRVVGFLDDDRALQGRTIGGVPVLGHDQRPRDASSTRATSRRSSSRCPPRPARRCAASSTPPPTPTCRRASCPRSSSRRARSACATCATSTSRTCSAASPRRIDVEQVRETLAGKVVAVTGAAGSIGSELCRQIMQLGPAQLAAHRDRRDAASTSCGSSSRRIDAGRRR